MSVIAPSLLLLSFLNPFTHWSFFLGTPERFSSSVLVETDLLFIIIIYYHYDTALICILDWPRIFDPPLSTLRKL